MNHAVFEKLILQLAGLAFKLWSLKGVIALDYVKCSKISPVLM